MVNGCKHTYTSTCNCQDKKACPLNGHYHLVVYEGTLSSNELNYIEKSILKQQKNILKDVYTTTIYLSETKVELNLFIQISIKNSLPQLKIQSTTQKVTTQSRRHWQSSLHTNQFTDWKEVVNAISQPP